MLLVSVYGFATQRTVTANTNITSESAVDTVIINRNGSYSSTIQVNNSSHVLTVILAPGTTLTTGATLNLWNGLFRVVVRSGATWQESFEMNLAGTQITNQGSFSGNIVYNASGQVVVNSGTWTGNVEIRNGGTFTQTAGSFNANWTQGSPSTVNINGGTFTFTNTGGGIDMNGGSFTVAAGATVSADRDINLNGTSLTINGTATLSRGLTNNSGTLTTGSTSNVSVSREIVLNSGTTTTLSGTVSSGRSLTANGSFTNTGSLSVTGSTTVNGGATFTNSGSFSTTQGFTANGSVNSSSGTSFSVGGNMTVASGSTFQTGGVTTIGGNVNSQGTITISGTMTASGTITNSGTINTNPTSGCSASLCGSTISNTGSVSGGTGGLNTCTSVSGGTASGTSTTTAPSTQPTNLALTISGDNVVGNFTAATAGTGYIVLKRFGTAVTDVPVAFVNYQVGNVIGNSIVAAIIDGRTTTTFQDSFLGMGCGSAFYTIFTANEPLTSTTTDQCGGAVVNTVNPLSGSITLPSRGGNAGADKGVCSSENSGLLTATAINGSVIRWEQSINAGATWNAIANTATATYTSAALTSETWFRAVIQGANCSAVNGTPIRITIRTAKQWVPKNGNWSETANWCGALPTGTDNVTINSSAFQPVIDGNFSVNNLTLGAGVTLTANANSNLTINGTFANSGAINTQNGTITFSGAAGQTIPAGTYNNITVGNSTAKTLAASGSVNILGVFNTNGQAITTTGSRIHFAGTTQNIPSLNYNKLVVSNGTKTLLGHTTVNDSLRINTGASINLNGFNLNVLGRLSSSSTSAITPSATSRLVINGTGTGIDALSFPANSTIKSLVINRPGLAALSLNSDITITDSLVLNSSSINTGGNTITLGATATIVSESTAGRIWGQVATTRTVGTGGSTFGNLGFEILPGSENLGNVTITRFLVNAGTPFGTVGVGARIMRGYRIDITGTQPSSGRRVGLSWFSDEDNGINTTNFAVWRRNTPTAQWNEITPDLRDFTTVNNRRTIIVTTNHFSDYTVGGGNGPLPVSLAYFSAKAQNKEAVIQWTTASEINNQKFVIERSYDGVDFTPIAEVKGNGTTNRKNQYYYTDNTVTTDAWYRLTQVDFDGKSETFSAVKVRFTDSPIAQMDIFPNPATNAAALAYPFEKGETYQLLITDLSGKEIKSQSLAPTVAQSILELDLSDMPTGTYLVRLQSSQGTSVKKLIKN